MINFYNPTSFLHSNSPPVIIELRKPAHPGLRGKIINMDIYTGVPGNDLVEAMHGYTSWVVVGRHSEQECGEGSVGYQMEDTTQSHKLPAGGLFTAFPPGKWMLDLIILTITQSYT